MLRNIVTLSQRVLHSGDSCWFPQPRRNHNHLIVYCAHGKSRCFFGSTASSVKSLFWTKVGQFCVLKKATVECKRKKYGFATGSFHSIRYERMLNSKLYLSSSISSKLSDRIRLIPFNWICVTEKCIITNIKYFICKYLLIHFNHLYGLQTYNDLNREFDLLHMYLKILTVLFLYHLHLKQIW